MWIYYSSPRVSIHLEPPECRLEYAYNSDCDTHLIQFQGGSIAFTKTEIKRLKKLLAGVDL